MMQRLETRLMREKKEFCAPLLAVVRFQELIYNVLNSKSRDYIPALARRAGDVFLGKTPLLSQSISPPMSMKCTGGLLGQPEKKC